MKKMLLLILVCFLLSGCASFGIKTPKVILLPEEKIYTVPAGQDISVLVDKKPITMNFQKDMKLVDPIMLVRQEEKLNNDALRKAKGNSGRNIILKIVGSILTIIAMVIGLIFKKSWFPKIKGNIEVK